MTDYIRYEEVSKHTTEDDLWFIKDGKVYNVTKYVDQHPGGVDTLLGVAGKDGTADFDAVGHSDSARELLKDFYVGELHPDDIVKVPASTQASRNNLLSFSIIFVLIAICLYFIFKP